MVQHPANLVSRVRRALTPGVYGGHTLGMKTAVSILDEVFADAERLAARRQPSRSKPYARALAECVVLTGNLRWSIKMDPAAKPGSPPNPSAEPAGRGDQSSALRLTLWPRT